MSLSRSKYLHNSEAGFPLIINSYIFIIYTYAYFEDIHITFLCTNKKMQQLLTKLQKISQDHSKYGNDILRDSYLYKGVFERRS